MIIIIKTRATLSLFLSLSLSLKNKREREKASKSFFLYAREVISFSLFLSFSAGVVQLLFRVTNETLNKLCLRFSHRRKDNHLKTTHHEKNTRELCKLATEKPLSRALSLFFLSLKLSLFSREKKQRRKKASHRSRLCSCF